MPKHNSISINNVCWPDKHKVLFETVFPASHQLVGQAVGEHLQLTSKKIISPNIWWAKHCDQQNICNSNTLVLISFSTQEGLTCLRTFKHPSCNFVVINDRNSRRHWACHMFQPHPNLRLESTCTKCETWSELSDVGSMLISRWGVPILSPYWKQNNVENAIISFTRTRK